VIDDSYSVGSPKYRGGFESGYVVQREFAANLTKIIPQVSQDAVRVGAVAFSTDASVGFTFASNGFERDSIAEGLVAMPIEKPTSTYTHLALELMRTDLLVDARADSVEGVYGAHLSTEIYTRGCHWFPRLFA
jgi:hypothetical protein